MIGICGMVVMNEDGMTGTDGWMAGWTDGKVIVTAEGIAVTGGYKNFVGPKPRS